MSVNLHVVLYQPRIPQNTGNIGRLCVGLNARLHLVPPLAFAIDEKKVRRAGLDYWPHLQLEMEPETWTPDESRGPFFLFTKRASRSIYDVGFTKGAWLVFGSEDTGLPKTFTERWPEQCVALPQYGPVRSQNLANAVAAASYLALRDLFQNGEAEHATPI